MNERSDRRPILILGAGGHGRVVADLLLDCRHAVAGLLDPDTSLWGTVWRTLTILGGDEQLAHYSADTHDLANGIGSTRDPELRRTLFELHVTGGYKFPPLRHARATVAVDVQLGDGSQIMAGAVVQTGTVLGRNVIVNTGACIDHDCHIGDHVHIAPGAVICGGVRIGENTHVGSGATVIQGIQIGNNCLIAAGAVVIDDVPDGATVTGIPAKQGLR